MNYDDIHETAYNLNVLPYEPRERVTKLLQIANRKDEEGLKLLKKSNAWAFVALCFIPLFLVGAIPFLLISFSYKNKAKDIVNDIKVIKAQVREIYIQNNLEHELNY